MRINILIEYDNINQNNISNKKRNRFAGSARCETLHTNTNYLAIYRDNNITITANVTLL